MGRPGVTSGSQSGPNTASGPGSISDAVGPAVDAVMAAAKAAEAESTGDPRVIAALQLGWLMEELTQGWSLSPVPSELSLDPEQKCQAQALELSKLLELLQLRGIEPTAVAAATGALQAGPAREEAGRLERNLVVALAGSDARLTKAFVLGGGLRALIAGESHGATDPQSVTALVGALDSLSSDLPAHAARGVANSLAEWSRSDAPRDLVLVEAQVNLWRSVITGEKRATELLEPEDYLEAARVLEGRFAHRALTSKWLWSLAVIALTLFGLGVYVLFAAKGHPGSVAAGASGVLAGLGITWKGIGGTVGKLVGKLEVPLWGAELDTAVTDAITLAKPGRGEPTSNGLSYADRRGRALTEAPAAVSPPGPGRTR